MKIVSLIAVAAMWVMNGGHIGAAAGAWAFATALWGTEIPEIILLIVALGTAIFALVYYWDDIANALIYTWGKFQNSSYDFGKGQNKSVQWSANGSADSGTPFSRGSRNFGKSPGGTRRHSHG